MKKVIIIDDEAAGRQLIREYLEAYPEYVLVGEANNGVDAVKVCNEFRPDLIFLDVQMPGLTGFQVLTHLEEIPQIIFSTAYDEYALEAFDVHAVDYLLKPYTKERFGRAMARLPTDDKVNNVSPLAESLLAAGKDYPERILVNKGRRLITLPVEDIVWIEANGDYSTLHAATDNYLSNYGISVIEKKLNPRFFIRIHRSSIINLQRVREVHRYGKSYDVVMDNDAVVRVSRGYMDKLKNITF
ncbi:MAG: LytR/AlgR family response regulator transcription factor [Lewinella sp.]